MDFQILNYTITIIDATLLLYFVSRFLKNMNANKKMIILSVALISFINIALGYVSGDGNPFTSIMMLVSTGIIYKLVFKEKIVNIYMYFFLGVLLMFVAEAITILVVLPFGITPNMMHENFQALFIAGLISKLVYFVIVRYFLPKLKLFKGISKTLVYQILLICMFNLIIIFMAFWFYKNSQMVLIKEHGNEYIVLTTLGALVFSVGILSVTRGIIKQSQKEAEWLIRETEYKRQMFYLGNIEDMLKSIRAQRHDFNNHISCIYGLLQLNKPEEAKSFIQKMSEDASAFNNIIDTGNPVLSSLLNTKITTAQRNKVEMYTDIKLPEKINIEPIDISIIIGNLLDNALEACAVVEKGDKSIELEVYTNNGNLIIRVKNSKSEFVHTCVADADSGYTSKGDQENHGFGLFNIRHAVSKYDGIVKFEDNGNYFCSSIAIPMKL
ncbi:MAG: histidine kinase [Clostridia bacterium]|nr:histidine kinase [Clostridia bacterium]